MRRVYSCVIGETDRLEADAGGGRGRTRTGTPVSQKQILSLLCLPFHHAAKWAFLAFPGVRMSHLCRVRGNAQAAFLLALGGILARILGDG